MKVCVVFNHPAPYKVNFFNELSKYVDLTVIFERTTAGNRPKSFYNANKYNFKTIFINSCNFGDEGSFSLKVKNYIKKHHKEFDYIIMNGYSHLAEIFAIRYLQRKRIPYVLLINGGIVKPEESNFKKKLKTSLISGASFYLSPAKSVNNYLIYYGVDPNKIFTYPYSNLFDSDFVCPDIKKDIIRTKYGLPLNKKIYTNASQFIQRKNNYFLISIFAKRKEHLVLVGEGDLLNEYQKYINENKIKNVTIISFLKRNELFELFRCCDGFITLAKADIFGHTTLEALACNLPVISSNKVMSSLEYIKDGVNGYLVDFNDENQINQAIDKTNKINTKNISDCIKDCTFKKCAKICYEILKTQKKHE